MDLMFNVNVFQFTLKLSWFLHWFLLFCDFQEFCSRCGIESLLSLLKGNSNNEEEPTDEKKTDKKTAPSKNKKEKEHGHYDE